MSDCRIRSRSFSGRFPQSFVPRAGGVGAICPGVNAGGSADVFAGPFAFCVDTMLTPGTVIGAADPSAGPSTTDVFATANGALGSQQAAQLYVDFMNSAEEILKAFQTYYETAELQTVTDPNIILDLKAKLDAG